MSFQDLQLMFFDAVRSGDVVAQRRLLDRMPSRNCFCGLHTCTCVHPVVLAIGATEGDPVLRHRAVRELLMSRCDVNRVSCHGAAMHRRTPFLRAIQTCDDKLVAFMMAMGKVDIHKTDGDLVYPLIWACYCQSSGMVGALLRCGASVNYLSSPNLDFWEAKLRTCFSWRAPLLMALETGNEDVVRTLVDDFSADVNLTAGRLVPAPLSYLLVTMPSLLEFFLQRGADPNFFTPQLSSCRQCKCELETSLYTRPPIYSTIILDKPGDLSMLVKYGADVNFQSEATPSPLALSLGHRLELTHRLLVHGADPNLKDKGVSPLSLVLCGGVCGGEFSDFQLMDALLLLVSWGAKLALTLESRHPYGVFRPPGTRPLSRGHVEFLLDRAVEHNPHDISKFLHLYSNISLPPKLYEVCTQPLSLELSAAQTLRSRFQPDELARWKLVPPSLLPLLLASGPTT